MAKAFMPTMTVAYPIESINRKLALRREVAGTKTIEKGDATHSVELPATKFMGGMVRTRKVCNGKNGVDTIQTQYLFVKKYKGQPEINADYIKRRNTFTAVSQGVAHILKDLSQITTVQMAFISARNDSTIAYNGVHTKGYSSLRDWVFAVQYAGLKDNDQYNVNQFPANPSN